MSLHDHTFPPRVGLEQHEELHARPALPATAPCVVSYWVQQGMSAALAERALAVLADSLGSTAPAPGQRHARLQGPDWQLKFERHGEFVSWQLNRSLAGSESGPLPSALGVLPRAFIDCLLEPEAGRMLAATHVQLLNARGDDEALNRYRRELGQAGNDGSELAPLMGSWIGDGRSAALLTRLQLEADGFTRFLLLDFNLPADQAAREAQRLCEIEAYRMLAMQGFPLAQAESQTLGELEQRLQSTVDAMANDNQHDDAQAFGTLTHLAAEVEHAAARTRYRFSATRAYHAIVQQRLTDLREQRAPGLQTLGGFLSRRFAPAMAFCESTDRRLSDLGERINRALNLARVRIEAQRENGNQELLRLLADRQQQQLRLQQTVEGLSVVAISYYLLSLIAYLIKGLHKLPWATGWLPTVELSVALALPPVLLGVALGMRRLRH